MEHLNIPMQDNEIIQTALNFYHSHCVKQAVRKRGRLNQVPGESMTRKFKQQQERIEELRIDWKHKADQVLKVMNRLFN